ncbi:hypothetical protein SCHPADRAFT_74622 [Schizopora paradoxa]|uniref:Uncharacterized protein n=1 Tax=Schizopora paradoxa TaxID=27342 RepID=A0A0H2S591_9AGAM|nr:hypothetical protein SCHPADRAFT_74622 [Schizopora paradoxa]
MMRNICNRRLISARPSWLVRFTQGFYFSPSRQIITDVRASSCGRSLELSRPLLTTTDFSPPRRTPLHNSFTLTAQKARTNAGGGPRKYFNINSTTTAKSTEQAKTNETQAWPVSTLRAVCARWSCCQLRDEWDRVLVRNERLKRVMIILSVPLPRG